MDLHSLLSNLQSPPILFFVLGLAAAIVRCELEIPAPATKLISLYLLWAIGFKGGVELHKSGLGSEAVTCLGLAIAFAIAVPFMAYAFARRRFAPPDAAALAATYGSVSAVTFLTACNFLNQAQVQFGGHMVAAMALMESPAIVVAVMLLRRCEPQGGGEGGVVTLRELLRDAFLNGPVVMLLGSVAVGLATGERGYAAMKPLCTDLFQGVLVFFLLDLGLLAGKRLPELREHATFLVPFGVLLPLVNAALALAASWLLAVELGDAVLLMVLAASASYIAVPAALRLAIPRARASIFVPAALAVTFPFNVVVGLPLYLNAATRVLVPG